MPKEQTKKWYSEFMKEQECQQCGKKPKRLEWHHREGHYPGYQNVPSLVSQGCSIERILAEIAKCDCLCRSCHIHAEWESGGQFGNHKLSLEQVREIRAIYARGKIKNLAKEFHVAEAAIYRIVVFTAWRDSKNIPVDTRNFQAHNDRGSGGRVEYPP